MSGVGSRKMKFSMAMIVNGIVWVRDKRRSGECGAEWEGESTRLTSSKGCERPKAGFVPVQAVLGVLGWTSERGRGGDVRRQPHTSIVALADAEGKRRGKLERAS